MVTELELQSLPSELKGQQKPKGDPDNKHQAVGVGDGVRTLQATLMSLIRLGESVR